MAHVLLSQTDEWQLVDDDQDVRGRDLLDAGGLRIGPIEDMVVDTDSEHVDAVVLADGTRYPAADLDIEDEAVYLRGAATETARTPYTTGGVRRVEVIDGADRDATPDMVVSATDTYAPAAPISGAAAGDYLNNPVTMNPDDDRDFESHYNTEYHASGNPYSFYQGAYHFGRDMSLDSGLLNTSFDDVETRVRDRWASAFPGLRYDDYRGAVRYGFERRRG